MSQLKKKAAAKKPAAKALKPVKAKKEIPRPALPNGQKYVAELMKQSTIAEQVVTDLVKHFELPKSTISKGEPDAFIEAERNAANKPEFEIKPPVKQTAPVDVDKEEAAPVGADCEPLKTSKPYILRIKNNSMELIRGFSINSIAQATRQGKGYDERVTVEYGLSGYTYQAFIQHFVTHPTRFAKVRYQAFHGYEKYRQKQLSECPLTIIRSEPDGHISKDDIVLYMALNQFIKEAVEQRVEFDFVDASWDMKVDLYPEAEISIHLFPSLTMKIWEQKYQPFSEPEIGFVNRIQITDDAVTAGLKVKVAELEAQLAEAKKPAVKAKAPVDAAFKKDKKKK